MTTRPGSRKSGIVEAMPGLRRVMARMQPYLKPHRGLVAGGSAALIASVLTKLAEPWPLKFVIDNVVDVGPGTARTTGFPALGGLTTQELLLACAIGLVVIIGFRALFEYTATICFAKAGSRVLTRVRDDLFRHLQQLPLSFHSRSRTGDLTMRLISDVGMLKETAVTAALPLAVNTLILFGMVGVMLWMNWQLALIALAPLPLLWVLSLSYGKRIQTVSRKQRRIEGTMAATAAESLAGIRTIKALGVEDQVARGFIGNNLKSLKGGVKSQRLSAGLERSVDLLVAVATALIIFFGARMVLAGRLSAGDLLVFITYLKNTFRPVRDYAKYSARLAKATAAGERVVALLDLPATMDREGAREADFQRGAISFRDVHFSYDSDRPQLRGVSVDIPAGQTVAITGPSGAGKSTFVSLLMRLHDPQSGRIEIDGTDIRDFTLKSLRSRISFVPQEALLFSQTLRENLTLGAGREIDDAEMQQVAARARAHDFIAALPEGYDTPLAERGGSLSAGQRQRIAIARAGLRRAPIFVLDEPTVGLDAENEQAVIEAIMDMARGRTTLIITHDLTLAARCDRILCLEGGDLVEDGRPAELLGQGGLFARLTAQAAPARRRN
ncbi:ABC transporter ATP-binding protein [Paracoccus sp. (in: a-proteobacteria)]|uniref:ABC transporter ATP-binding protein n=1 Tax=Paracoccus sp. TaxID=267 RepID=UPI0026DFE0A1|nr:ABC transporter ATP-binding protein [Paracoccus sp. (in: a-proteobacteria)]MDO5370902.1 ABC transporter ATP-binding protein [Paracoccus sp. (in: a-proteobacteria)]